MFTLMLEKLLHKKWMVVCLLIGNILLISVAVSHPMYRVSSFQRMLTDEFEEYEEANPEAWNWPATFTVIFRKASKAAGTDVAALKQFFLDSNEEFGIDTLETIEFHYLAEQKAEPAVERDETVDWGFKLSMMTDFYDHIELVAGRLPSDELVDGNCIEVIVP